MIRKKTQKGDHMDETWLIPYADLLTLLLALFIVLFAMSEIDSKRVQKFAETFNLIFSGGTGVMKYPNELMPHSENSTLIVKQEEAKTADEEGKSAEDRKLTKEYLEKLKKLEELKRTLDQYIKANHLEGLLETSIGGMEVKLTIREKALFESGKADILPRSRELAGKISMLLEKAQPREIIIAGHTDNVPIHNREFESNWDLSTVRALNFLKVLLENKNLDPARFSAVGYGEYRPVASNETEAGRAQNRRVEIIIRLF